MENSTPTFPWIQTVTPTQVTHDSNTNTSPNLTLDTISTPLLYVKRVIHCKIYLDVQFKYLNMLLNVAYLIQLQLNVCIFVHIENLRFLISNYELNIRNISKWFKQQ